MTKASVLVVDDDPGMCAMLSSRLTNRGFAVRTASTGVEAIEIAQRDDIEVVVSDVNMKGMNGVELCQRLLEHRPQLPVILITAFGSMDLAIQAIRAGAYDFVPKPFEETDEDKKDPKRDQTHQWWHDVNDKRLEEEKAKSIDDGF